MISLIIKSLLTLGGLAYSVYLFSESYWGWAISLIFVTSVVVLTIFKNERIIMAMVNLRTQKMDKALAHLNKIKQPEYLIKSQRAYYYYLYAMVGGQELGMAKSEALMRKALEIGLRTKQDQAVAKMQLGAICAGTGKKREAQLLLADAKKLDEKGMLTAQLKDLKARMGQAPSKNQMRMAQMSKGKGFRQKKTR
jgi:hypothetical protein